MTRSEPLPFAVLKTLGEDGRPDVGGIELLHRAGESYVRLMRRPHPDSTDLELLPSPYASVEVGRLREMFPEFARWLTQDGFFSINGFFRRGTHKARDVRYLNALYCDLDYHKAGATAGQAVGMVVDAVEHGVIPPPTVLVYSGEGLWVFFALVDPKDGSRGLRVHYPHDPALRVYNATMRALHTRLSEAFPGLNPDPNAVDASRLIRIPGSVNSGSTSYVRFVVFGGPDGQTLPTYLLEDIAKFCGVDVDRPVFPRRVESRGSDLPPIVDPPIMLGP